jgi:ankyrin repeat protein
MINTTLAGIERSPRPLFLGLLILFGAICTSKVTGQEMSSKDFFSGLDRIQTTCNDLSRGEIASIKQLVDNGVSLDTPGKHGMTLLLWAWCSSNPVAFEALLEFGADPHARLTSDVQIEVALNPLLLENGSSVVENVVRYNRVQQNFLEKVVRFLRKANDQDRLGRSLIHLLMLDADDRLIIRKPLPAVQHGRHAKEVTEFLEESRRESDQIKS